MTGRGPRSRLGDAGERGQSNVIAVLILAAMVITGAVVVVSVGSSALSQNRNEATFSAAEESIQSLGTSINQVSKDGGNTEIDLSEISNGETKIDESAGQLTIEVKDPTGATTQTSSGTTQLGTLYHQQEQREIAYQSGGVFESSGEGSSVISPPPISYRVSNGQPSLTFPVVRVQGTSAGDELTAERTRVQNLIDEIGVNLDPGNRMSGKNVIPEGNKLTLTVTSEYYLAWGEVFEEQLGVTPVYDDSTQSVSFELDGTYDPASGKTRCVRNCGPGGGGGGSANAAPDAAILSGDTPGSIANKILVDSYNSTEGPYQTSRDEVGDVRINGSITFQNNPDFKGDIHATDGMASLKNKIYVDGNTILGDYPGGIPQIDSGNHEFNGLFSMNDTFKSDGTQIRFNSDLIVDDVTDFGKVTAMGDVHVHGDFDADASDNAATIEGNLIVDGDAKLHSDLTVKGDVYANGSVDKNGATIRGGGTLTTNANGYAENKNVEPVIRDLRKPQVPVRPRMNDKIDDKESAYGADNDNAGTIFNAGWVEVKKNKRKTVTTGNYTANKLFVEGTLVLKPDTGPINIYVDKTMTVPRQGTVVVKGDSSDLQSRVNIYIGDNGGGNAFQMKQQGRIVTGSKSSPTDEAPLMWVYLKDSSTASFSQGAEFTGVLYGSGGTYSKGSLITLANKAHIHGTVIGDLNDFPNNVDISYDEALRGRSIDGDDPGSGGGGSPKRVYKRFGPGSGVKPEVAFFQTSYRVVEVE